MSDAPCKKTQDDTLYVTALVSPSGKITSAFENQNIYGEQYPVSFSLVTHNSKIKPELNGSTIP